MNELSRGEGFFIEEHCDCVWALDIGHRRLHFEMFEETFFIE